MRNKNILGKIILILYVLTSFSGILFAAGSLFTRYNDGKLSSYLTTANITFSPLDILQVTTICLLIITLLWIATCFMLIPMVKTKSSVNDCDKRLNPSED